MNNNSDNNSETDTSKLSALDKYWFDFLKETGRDMEERCSGDLDFEASGINNDALISLILSGKKTAFFSSYSSFAADGEVLPVSGELYLVLDRGKNPRCVIELESVAVLPFCEVTSEMVERDGEDASLTDWRNRMQEVLEEEGAIVGFTFRPDIRLIYQTFRVVYRK